MAALPVLKLGTLALKTLSKPIASRLKKQAGLHPKFRNFIVSIAQANHRITTTMQRRIYGHATNVEIRPLDEEKAVQAAVDLLGEAFVFSFSNSDAIRISTRSHGGFSLNIRSLESFKRACKLRIKSKGLAKQATESSLESVSTRSRGNRRECAEEIYSSARSR